VQDRGPVWVEYGENDYGCERFVLEINGCGRGVFSEKNAWGTLLPGVRDIVRVALDHLYRDLLLFPYPADAGCAACDEALSSTLYQQHGTVLVVGNRPSEQRGSFLFSDGGGQNASVPTPRSEAVVRRTNCLSPSGQGSAR
jgi:hypothetical protein